MNVIYTLAEAACIELFAEFFEKGKARYRSHSFEELLRDTQLTKDNCDPVLTMLKERGIISDLDKFMHEGVVSFTITSRAVQEARQMIILKKQEEESKDIVEQVTKALRRKPVVGWIIIVSIIIGVIVSVAANVSTIINNLWPPEQKPPVINIYFPKNPGGPIIQK